jgi:hypothetical protein
MSFKKIHFHRIKSPLNLTITLETLALILAPMEKIPYTTLAKKLKGVQRVGKWFNYLLNLLIYCRHH